MYKHINIVAILIATITNANGAPQDHVTSTTTTLGPTVITGDKMGSATFYDGSNSTTIVYQAEDTSIHMLQGFGPPTSGSSYSSSVILAAGQARNDTPLAIATDYSPYFNQIHLFYLSSISCDGGNYLYDLRLDPATNTWRDGTLNALQICSSSSSNLLYALGPRVCALNAFEDSGPLRVGFVSASTNYLTEAYQSSSSWAVVQY